MTDHIAHAPMTIRSALCFLFALGCNGDPTLALELQGPPGEQVILTTVDNSHGNRTAFLTVESADSPLCEVPGWSARLGADGAPDPLACPYSVSFIVAEQRRSVFGLFPASQSVDNPITVTFTLRYQGANVENESRRLPPMEEGTGDSAETSGGETENTEGGTNEGSADGAAEGSGAGGERRLPRRIR